MQTHNLFCAVGITLLLGVMPCEAQGEILLNETIFCKFQYNQFMDSNSEGTNTQKSALEWSFVDLFGSQPHFISGSDSGQVLIHQHSSSNGISIWLTQGNGAHLFTIWPDGTAFWSKHNDIFGSKATQQFRGRCANVP